MRRTLRSGVTAAATILFTASAAFALGGNHEDGPVLLQHDDWPAGLINLVNTGNRVHGYWVNSNDVFFYRGDADTLKDFFAKYGEVKDTPLKVVIHTGEKPLTGGLGDPKTIPFDWQLSVMRRGWGVPIDPRRPKNDPGYVVTVHVWLGDNITLNELKIPKHMDVISAGDIEDYINRHKSRD